METNSNMNFMLNVSKLLRIPVISSQLTSRGWACPLLVMKSLIYATLSFLTGLLLLAACSKKPKNGKGTKVGGEKKTDKPAGNENKPKSIAPSIVNESAAKEKAEAKVPDGDAKAPKKEAAAPGGESKEQEKEKEKAKEEEEKNKKKKEEGGGAAEKKVEGTDDEKKGEEKELGKKLEKDEEEEEEDQAKKTKLGEGENEASDDQYQPLEAMTKISNKKNEKSGKSGKGGGAAKEEEKSKKKSAKGAAAAAAPPPPSKKEKAAEPVAAVAAASAKERKAASAGDEDFIDNPLVTPVTDEFPSEAEKKEESK